MTTNKILEISCIPEEDLIKIRELKRKYRVIFKRPLAIYTAQVREVTRKQPLHLLVGIEKRNYYDYQLDHKYSIKSGFDNCISPEIIGWIGNLEVLRSKDNFDKKHKCSTTLTELLDIWLNAHPNEDVPIFKPFLF
ncbi:MAG TPA: hypothetical protein VII94_05690 [Candidatus Saccharimonadales bacterium]